MEIYDPSPSESASPFTPASSSGGSDRVTPNGLRMVSIEALRARLHEPAHELSRKLLDSKTAIALGVIRIKLNDERDRLLEIGIPQEWPEDPVALRYNSLCQNIAFLQDDGSIITEVIRNHLMPGFSIRLYIPIEALGRRGHLPPSISKARRDVMRHVEKGHGFWMGSFWFSDPIDTHFQESYGSIESLFFLFNTLPSPQPFLGAISDRYKRHAAEDILNNDIPGLRTELYPFQQESAAMMIQRESSPKEIPEIGYSCLEGPTGQKFYYRKSDGAWQLETDTFREPAGGILAETMGYGKTIICLAVILATRGCLAQVPAGRETLKMQKAKGKRSLFDICADAINLKQIPWKSHFYSHATHGLYYENCVKKLQQHQPGYLEDRYQQYLSSGKRRSPRTKKKPETIRLSYATLIIVPPNLLSQWQQEIEKHIDKDALDVLVLDNNGKEIPDTKALLGYDVVLISRNRLDQENLSDPEDDYSSLCTVRWVRVILDEGAGFGSTSFHNETAAFLNKLHFDGRWIVSGALSNSLRGVEVDMNDPKSTEPADQGPKVAELLIDSCLAIGTQREGTDLQILTNLAQEFLQWQPWRTGGTPNAMSWRKHIRLQATFSSQSLHVIRQVLESIVVRHRFEDIHQRLPKLHHEVKILEPSYYDKLNTNLFSTLLAVNAVASERQDQDYMFHPANRKYLDQLINNSRHATFHWTFEQQQVQDAVKEGRSYLESETKTISERDLRILRNALDTGDRAIQDPNWRSFADMQDIGLFVENFPEAATEAWVSEPASPLLLVMQMVKLAQKHVQAHEQETDPAVGLAGAGLKAMLASKASTSATAPVPMDARTTSVRGKDTLSVVDQLKRKRTPGSSESPLKKSKSYQQPSPASISPSSELSKTSLVGFSSAKLSYLISQVLTHMSVSRILIFYSGNNTGFWIAEALERVFVTCFRIYANTIAPSLRNSYLKLFQEDPAIRILLMDIRQASHGLTVTAANRVYIVEPIWQPHIEAQAIKRAHRIGQTREVFVETLVLKGTLEEKMLERRDEMSRGKQREAARSLLDDEGMKSIVKRSTETFLPFTMYEKADVGARVARLDSPRKLFVETKKASEESEFSVHTEGFDGPSVEVEEASAKKKVKMVQFGDWQTEEQGTA